MSYSLILKINDMLKAKKISCTELTKLYIDRINKQNSKINAYITITEEQALKQALKVDKMISLHEAISPLTGVPMTLKDNIYTKGIRTSCSSKLLYDFIPKFNATAYTHLKNQNAVLLGKTNADEFSMGGLGKTSYFGKTINPHNERCYTGGSSSGGSAAVADKQAVYALGSDTGGSVRLPAAFCGDVGLKPTYGSISRNGLIVYSIGYDQIGPIASTVEDVCLVFDAIAKEDAYDPTTHLQNKRQNTFNLLNRDIKGIKIGILKQCTENLDKSVEDSFYSAIRAYEDMGAKIVNVSIPEVHYSMSIYKILSNVEAFLNMQKYKGEFIEKENGFDIKNYTVSQLRSKGFGDVVKARMMFGAYVLDNIDKENYYKSAIDMQKSLKSKFDNILSEVDFIMSPTSAITAVKMDDDEIEKKTLETDKFTSPANIVGIPAVSVPCGYDIDNLPIGLQIMGKRYCEADILNIANCFEKYTDLCYTKQISNIPFD